MISSYVRENKLFESLSLSGELELELNPKAPWPSASALSAKGDGTQNWHSIPNIRPQYVIER